MHESRFYYCIHNAIFSCNRKLTWAVPFEDTTTSAHPAGQAPKTVDTDIDINVEIGTLDWLQDKYPTLPWARIESGTRFQPTHPQDAHTQAADVPFPHFLHTDDALLMRSQNENHLFAARLSLAGDTIHIGLRGAPHIPPADLETAAVSYWLPSLLGLSLRLGGRLILHANAASIDGRAVIWLGTKGAGKSTLAAAFAAAGYPILADDQVALYGPDSAHCKQTLPHNKSPAASQDARQDGIAVWPGSAHIRLWSDSVAALENQAQELQLEYPLGTAIKGLLNGRSTVQQPQTWRFIYAPQPLAAVYLLEPRDPALDAPRFSRLSPAIALYQLLNNRLAARTLPVADAHTQADFASLAALCRQVPVYTLQLPDRLDALSQAVARLAKHARAATLAPETAEQNPLETHRVV